MDVSPDIVIRPGTLTLPLEAEEIFGRDAPLFVEIGVGSGSFIQDLARRRPDVNVLGIDRAAQSVARSYRRIAREQLGNARLFKGDAGWVVRNVVPPGGLRRAYVNFPDPWPRKKHRGRRLLQVPFLRVLAARLADDGDLLVTTDHDAYFRFVLENAEAACFSVEVREPPPEVLGTKWARKASTHYHAALRPVRPVDDVPIDIELADPMYHAVLDGDLPRLTEFEKRTHRRPSGIVVVMDAYRELDDSGYAFLVHVEEVGLSQEVIVEVRRGREGYVVSLRRFGEPLHTRGLRAAVKVITEWFVESGMTLIHQKY